MPKQIMVKKTNNNNNPNNNFDTNIEKRNENNMNININNSNVNQIKSNSILNNKEREPVVILNPFTGNVHQTSPTKIIKTNSKKILNTNINLQSNHSPEKPKKLLNKYEK
jgi:hypothetical protein